MAEPIFDARSLSLQAGDIRLSDLHPLIDGHPADCGPPELRHDPTGSGNDPTGSGSDPIGHVVIWPLRSGPRGKFFLRVAPHSPHAQDLSTAGLLLQLSIESNPNAAPLQSIGLRIGTAAGVQRYLRNGYTSWDGSYFVALDRAATATNTSPGLDKLTEPENPATTTASKPPAAATGYAMTALLSPAGGTAVLGFLRHDRYQNRLRFDLSSQPDHAGQRTAAARSAQPAQQAQSAQSAQSAQPGPSLAIDLETLLDGAAIQGPVQAEPLVLLSGQGVEATLRDWARLVAADSPRTPRLRRRRITGWCSWYSLYASISEAVLLEHLRAATRFRDAHAVPFEVFQIDDGFTPEMGDWLDVKSQFPRGMAALLSDIRAAGFTPGLWIAPFMVGNRSRLYAAHPDWVVRERKTGKPLAPMKFYGEFRWHKRSEEYYILDVTHPAAEAYIREVFRTWTREWGCEYFKTDFMYFGAEYGPEEAIWHQPGLSRMQVWMRMATLIREEIGDALWLGCGGPIWAPVGLMDAVRIGRDVGVSWQGHHSAQSLLRDQTSRNFANGILWQADPDCILLRDRFHDLTDAEVRSLAWFAGLSGGLLMTSDQLDEVPEERRALLADLIGDGTVRPCDFPALGRGDFWPDPVLIQQVTQSDGSVLTNVFNTGDAPVQRTVAGSRLQVGPHENRLLTSAKTP